MTSKDLIRLDIKDKKILELLNENSRYSNTQIAKKVSLSKPAVEYRIKRLEKNGLIFNYYTTINFTKLGYSQYKVYIKLQNTTIEDEKRIIAHLVKTKNIIWVAQIRGPYDLTISLLAKNNFEFSKILEGFNKEFSQFILEKNVILTEYSPIYSKSKEFLYGIPEKTYELDEEDTKILNVLATDSRISILDLADKTSLTRDIVSYRLKKLQKGGIVVQFRYFPNYLKQGKQFYKIILKTKNFDEKSEKEIKKFCSANEKIPQLLKLMGSWDLEIEVEVENEEELYRILNEIRKEFSDIIRDFDILRITETFKYNYFPF